MSWRKDSLLNKWCRGNWISTCRRLKQDPRLLHCTSNNSKWIKDLKVRSESEINPGKTENRLDHKDIGNNFMNETPITQQLRESIDKCEYIKLKMFCTAKETVTRQIFTSYPPEKGLIIRIYKAFKKLTSQIINSSLKKWANELNRQLSNETQMANKHRQILKRPGHKGNANQNCIESPPHPSHNVYLQ
jgi:hypothetical protein